MKNPNVPVHPFFIVGCPRTGTTLLRRILSSSNQVAIPPESLFIYEYLRAEHVPLEKRKVMFCNDPAFESWNIHFTYKDLANCHTMADCIITAHQKYAFSQGKPFWGHKTQTLIRYVNTIATHIPQTFFIHIVRDSRAVANSLKHSEVHRLNVLMGARRYNLDTNFGLMLEQRYPERTRRIYYEDLVQNPEIVLKQLCNWIGIKFEPKMLENRYRQLLPLEKNELLYEHHRNIDKPINPKFSDKWKYELSQVEIDIVNTLTAQTMSKLGYKMSGRVIILPKSTIASLRLQHFVIACYVLIKNFWSRPNLWHIVRRKWQLGTLFPMFKDLFQGR